MSATDHLSRLLRVEHPERVSMETVAVRIPPKLYKEIERWVHEGVGSRSDILRKLIELGRQSLDDAA